MFDETDIMKLRAFSKVVEQASYDVKGNAITSVASLLVWFGQLEGKIEQVVKQSKKLEDPAKKV